MNPLDSAERRAFSPAPVPASSPARAPAALSGSPWTFAPTFAWTFAWAFVVASLLTLSGCATLNPRAVEIQRTALGVAHVKAPDAESLAYGVAYAHAQDNVCQTADHLLTVRGERSQYLGAAARGQLGLRSFSNEQIDFFVQWHMDDAALARAWTTVASPSAQAFARGYVAGYNRYLSDAGATLPAACRGQPWLRPMTLADYRRSVELGVIQAGIALFADSVLAAQPPAVRVGHAQQPDGVIALAPSVAQRVRSVAAPDAFRVATPDDRQAAASNASPDAASDAASDARPDAAHLAEAARDARERGLLDLPIGSNGWAFGREASADGRGVLLGNPHFPWDGVNRFWQVHATIPGQFDVMGAAIGLSPIPQIGFNRDVAWTHTVSTGKRFTVHELVLDSESPTTYRVDGQAKALERRTLSIRVREPDGTLATRQATVWGSVYGPVLVIPRAGITWTPRRAYAIQDANAGNVRSIDAWLAMGQARDVAGLRAGLAGLGLPWVNTIAADRHGQVLYADASAVPDVSAEQLRRCAPSPQMGALFAAAGLPVLDGSRSDCNWQRDTTSPAPGLTPIARLPVLERADWVQNSNDSFWLSNPAARWTGISPMVGAVGTPQRLRTREALRDIEQQLRTGPVDVARVQALLLAQRNGAAHLVLDDLLAACGKTPEASTEAVLAACRVLGAWSRSNGLDAQGAHLFREWWRVAKDVPGVWRVGFDAKDPVHTPSGLKLADDAVRAKVFDALGAAVAIVRDAGFALDTPLGQVQARRTARGLIGIPGGDEFEGVLNKVETQGRAKLVAGGYAVNYGTSYVQAVGFDARGPVAEGLLTYGQSSDPTSPRAFEGLALLSGPRWPRLPFHAEDVARERVGPVVRLLVP